MGEEGCRSPSRTHHLANTGASTITKNEFTDWNHADGNAHPNSSVRVSWSPNSEIVEPACSKIAQNTNAASENTITAAMRWLSRFARNPKPTIAATGSTT